VRRLSEKQDDLAFVRDDVTPGPVDELARRRSALHSMRRRPPRLLPFPLRHAIAVRTAEPEGIAVPIEKTGPHSEPLEPTQGDKTSADKPDLMAAITRASASGPFLSDLVTPERAQQLFGDRAADLRACLLEAQGPAREALIAKMAGPLAKRAALSYQRLTRIDASELPDEWAAIIVRAAATPRSTSINGREGIVSPIDAQNTALAYHELSPAERDTVACFVRRACVAGQADASPAQALILKALGARRAALTGGNPSLRNQALAELSEFACAIEGLDFGRLMRSTSLLDIDETVDTRGFDPLSLEDRPDRPLSYTGVDNDGLFQRYEMSCGPASIEVLLGERDPAYALRRRSTPMEVNPAAADDIQTQVLNQYGLTPASRVVPVAIVRLRAAMSALERSGRLSHDAAKQLAMYLLGSPASSKGPLVDSALATIQAANRGFPDAATAQQIRAYVPPEPGKAYRTIGFTNVAILLNRFVGNRLGIEYKLHSLYEDEKVRIGSDDAALRSPDFVRKKLDLLEQNLAEGLDIIFGTGYPDHFWSMSNVQGEAPEREFLIHDTWSGKTGWAAESQLAGGHFARAFLGERKTSTFIDLFYLAG
jgi:hypothetical protein